MTDHVEITFQYFDDCPNWRTTRERLQDVVADLNNVELVVQRVVTPEEAAAIGFRGSPTILVNGNDAFVDDPAPVVGTWACRLYQTEDGSPTLDQLRDAVRSHE